MVSTLYKVRWQKLFSNIHATSVRISHIFMGAMKKDLNLSITQNYGVPIVYYNKVGGRLLHINKYSIIVCVFYAL
jgi:hypothetical protein